MKAFELNIDVDNKEFDGLTISEVIERIENDEVSIQMAKPVSYFLARAQELGLRVV